MKFKFWKFFIPLPLPSLFPSNTPSTAAPETASDTKEGLPRRAPELGPWNRPSGPVVRNRPKGAAGEIQPSGAVGETSETTAEEIWRSTGATVDIDPSVTETRNRSTVAAFSSPLGEEMAAQRARVRVFGLRE